MERSTNICKMWKRQIHGLACRCMLSSLYLWLYELVFNICIYIWENTYLLTVLIRSIDMIYIRGYSGYTVDMSVYKIYYCYCYWHNYFVHGDIPRFMHLTLNNGVPNWGVAKLITFGMGLVDSFWGSRNFGPYMFLCSSYQTGNHLLCIDPTPEKLTAANLGYYMLLF